MLRNAAELIEDFSLYPRSQVDGTHVISLAEALIAGEKLPAIIIDDQDRIIDGFHRRRAYLKAFGDKAEIEVDVRNYVNDKERFLDALRYNSRHGKGITGSEQTGAILKAMKFDLKQDVIASALGITQERVDKIVQGKTGIVRQGVTSKGEMIAIKRSVRHLAGKEVTKEQADVMSKLPGQDQELMINQLTLMIETECLDFGREGVVKSLIRLRGLLNSLVLEKTG